jgi:hypothetical protein
MQSRQAATKDNPVEHIAEMSHNGDDGNKRSQTRKSSAGVENLGRNEVW